MRRKGGRKGNREKEGVAFWGSSLLPLLLQLKRQEEEEEVGRGKALIFRCGGPSVRPSVRPSVLHAQGFFPFPLSSFSLVFLCYPSYSHLFFPGLLFGYFFSWTHLAYLPPFSPPSFLMKRKKKEASPSVRKAFSSVRSAYDDDDSRKKRDGRNKIWA